MTKKVTVQYWAKIGSRDGSCKHVFQSNVRRDMWDSLSEYGRERFIHELICEKLQCGFREVPETENTNA